VAFQAIGLERSVWRVALPELAPDVGAAPIEIDNSLKLDDRYNLFQSVKAM
jgi:hypothetical protein